MALKVKPPDIDANELEERLFALLSETKERFDSAWVSVGDEPRRLRLSAETPGAASVEMIPDPGQIDVSVGREGRMELLNLPSIDAAIDAIRPLVEAVAEGRFEETVWTLWGRTLRAQSRFKAHEGEVQMVSRMSRPLGFLIPGRRVEINYSAYG